MLFHAVRLSIRQWFGRTVPFASAALFLLMACNTEPLAAPLPSPDHTPLPLVSSPAGFPGSYEAGAGSVDVPTRSRESLARIAIFAAATSSSAGVVAQPAAETLSVVPPSNANGEIKKIVDWNGVRRDAAILFGAQIVATGFIYYMPESISSWSSEQKKNSFKKYGQNFISPTIDKDKFYINYILHPYWGAAYYTRARERGLKKGEALAYSTVISSLFEFGVECFYEKPSIQDLIVTPVVGSLIGAYIFEPWRDSIKRKGEMRWYDHAGLIATDPIGVLSSGFEKLFGIKPAIAIEYSVPKLQKGSAGFPAAANDTRVGVVWQFPLD